MEDELRASEPAEPRKRWEKPVVSDVSLESDEDTLGACYSGSSAVETATGCGPVLPCAGS